MKSGQPIALKVYSKDSVKRMTRIPSEYASLNNFIVKHFKDIATSYAEEKNYVVSYFDNEGDEITISDDEDLGTAEDFARQMESSIFKVYVRHKDEDPLEEGHYRNLLNQSMSVANSVHPHALATS